MILDDKHSTGIDSFNDGHAWMSPSISSHACFCHRCLSFFCFCSLCSTDILYTPAAPIQLLLPQSVSVGISAKLGESVFSALSPITPTAPRVSPPEQLVIPPSQPVLPGSSEKDVLNPSQLSVN